MKNVSLYIDLAFCFIFLPLMIFIFPVERWWGTYPLFFSVFIGWLYVTYFVYKYFIVPNLFHGRKQRFYALAAMAFSLLITFLLSSYEISSPFYHLRQQQIESVSYPVWGVRQNQQAVWLHYIVVVTFCFAVGMLTEAYRQRLRVRKWSMNAIRPNWRFIRRKSIRIFCSIRSIRFTDCLLRIRIKPKQRSNASLI